MKRGTGEWDDRAAPAMDPARAPSFVPEVRDSAPSFSLGDLLADGLPSLFEAPWILLEPEILAVAAVTAFTCPLNTRDAVRLASVVAGTRGAC